MTTKCYLPAETYKGFRSDPKPFMGGLYLRVGTNDQRLYKVTPL